MITERSASPASNETGALRELYSFKDIKALCLCAVRVEVLATGEKKANCDTCAACLDCIPVGRKLSEHSWKVVNTLMQHFDENKLIPFTEIYPPLMVKGLSKYEIKKALNELAYYDWVQFVSGVGIIIKSGR